MPHFLRSVQGVAVIACGLQDGCSLALTEKSSTTYALLLGCAACRRPHSNLPAWDQADEGWAIPYTLNPMGSSLCWRMGFLGLPFWQGILAS